MAKYEIFFAGMNISHIFPILAKMTCGLPWRDPGRNQVARSQNTKVPPLSPLSYGYADLSINEWQCVKTLYPWWTSK